MGRFTLTQLLMAVCLFAIGLAFLRSEGCGTRYKRVGYLTFSPDGQRIAVARYDAQDANVRFKRYKANTCRTVSVFDTSTCRLEKTVEQILLRGNQGPAWSLYGWTGEPFCFLPDSKTLVLAEYGGGAVQLCDVETSQISPLANQNEASTSVSISQEAGILATGHWQGFTIWNVEDQSKVRTIWTDNRSRGSGPRMAISPDGKLIATGGADGVKLWDVATGAQLFVIPFVGDVFAFGFVDSDQHLAVASQYGGVAVYDFTGKQVGENIVEGGFFSACFSPDGRRLAIASGQELRLLDVRTGNTESITQSSRFISGITFSPDGNRLAASGDYDKLMLWDAQSLDLLQECEVPGRSRLPWTVPGVFLLIWSATCYWLHRKRKQPIRVVATRQAPQESPPPPSPPNTLTSRR